MEVAIAINDKNAPRINRLIDSVEGSMKVRVLTYDDILDMCARTEDWLDIPKCDMLGVEIFADVNAGRGGAYNKSPLSTQFRARKTPAGWRLTEVSRGYYWKTKNRGIVYLTDRAKAAIIAKKTILE